MASKLKPPNVIYLQYYGDGDASFAEGPPAEVTWCQDRVFPQDVKYVRAKNTRPKQRRGRK